MVETHHLRRVKLFKDTKTDKYFKLLLGHNEESKKYVLAYKKSYDDAQRRRMEQEILLSQHEERRNRVRNSSKHDRESSGSRARASLGRD